MITFLHIETRVPGSIKLSSQQVAQFEFRHTWALSKSSLNHSSVQERPNGSLLFLRQRLMS